MIPKPLSPHMKRRNFLKLMTGTVVASGLAGALPAAAQLALATVTDGTLTIEFDTAMHSRLISGLGGASTVLTDFAPSDTLSLSDGRRIDAFNFAGHSRAAVNTIHGKGTAHTVRGVSAEGIEKTLVITLYERYPGFALVKTTYRNRGETPLSVQRWRAHAYALKSAGTGFWSWSGATHENRRDWVQPVAAGFDQPNFMGMNASDYGSGTPIVDAWRPDAGLAVGHVETRPKLVSLPLLGTAAGASVAIEESRAFELAAGESFTTLETFVTVHQRDYYATLDTYRRIMADKGMAAPKPTEGCYEAIWCAWGYDRDFTIAEIEGSLAKVKEMGLEWAVIDDGWQTSEGDWYLDVAKFPRKDEDMIALVQMIRAAGLKPKLWLAPLAVDPGTDLLRYNTDQLVLNEWGAVQDVSWWNAFYLCPAYGPVRDFTKALITKIIGEWGFDGIKLDGQHMNAVAPCHNPKHNHAHPNDSVEQIQDFWKMVYDTAIAIKPHAVIEFCPCGTAYAFYNLPYTNQVPSSDPLSSWQIRHKGKSLKALMGGDAAYAGDHVELSDNGTDFASSVGIGAIVSTKFTYPHEGRGKDANFLLTPEREVVWRKWIDIYNQKMLPKGQYRGELYDIGFDKPEAHAIEKDGKLYYAFYAPTWNGEVELRGLKKGNYAVRDYFNNSDLGRVNASGNRLNAAFDGFLLLEATPVRG
ncbi:MAG: glycoside hydrolase family 36 protein [Asticcacaulis sp.]